ncbi:hypothetical protein DVH24_009540 [Malus domestica]|uniref:Uncharacterized protein n=1 Tax=Malus domestica TaxID=3750 RepID=A0A498IR80_MALDO|nr:hypothetical protein DVH24_009540 [Malus domestica]
MEDARLIDQVVRRVCGSFSETLILPVFFLLGWLSLCPTRQQLSRGNLFTFPCILIFFALMGHVFVTWGRMFLSHPGPGRTTSRARSTTVARYCPLWAPTTPSRFCFWELTSNFPVGLCFTDPLNFVLRPSRFKLAELWWPRGIQRCSDRIHKSRTHPRVCHLSNWKFFFKASELCKWLRHSHVTASTPSFGTGCVSFTDKFMLVSNIVYLDSPAGVGFAYSQNQTKYITGDIQTALDTHAFLLQESLMLESTCQLLLLKLQNVVQ